MRFWPLWRKRRHFSAPVAALPEDAAAGAAGATDRGLFRESNEDCFLYDEARGLFVVADGMGGYAGGAEASSLAVATLEAFLTIERIQEAWSGDEQMEEMLRLALNQANERILEAAGSNPDFAEMGSTAVVALYRDTTLSIANIGDSRAYLIRNDTILLLTRDHTVAAERVEMGALTTEEVCPGNTRHELTACLGDPPPLPLAITTWTLQPGDRVLLCTDGLWDRLDEAEIVRIISTENDPLTACQTLLSAANRRGGYDNITVILLKAGRETAKCR